MIRPAPKATESSRKRSAAKRLATRLAELWPADRPHLPVAEIAEWFATYVYLPKLRDRVVLENAIRDALAKLDPKFAYAETFDEAVRQYAGLLWQKAPIGPMPQTRTPRAAGGCDRATACRCSNAAAGGGPDIAGRGPGPVPPLTPGPTANQQPRRFYGSVEIDMVRPVKAFDAILTAVVMELQRTQRHEGEADAGDRGRCGRRLLRGRYRRRPRQRWPTQVQTRIYRLRITCPNPAAPDECRRRRSRHQDRWTFASLDEIAPQASRGKAGADPLRRIVGRRHRRAVHPSRLPRPGDAGSARGYLRSELRARSARPRAAASTVRPRVRSKSAFTETCRCRFLPRRGQ